MSMPSNFNCEMFLMNALWEAFPQKIVSPAKSFTNKAGERVESKGHQDILKENCTYIGKNLWMCKEHISVIGNVQYEIIFQGFVGELDNTLKKQFIDYYKKYKKDKL